MGIFSNDDFLLDERVRRLEDQVAQLWRLVQSQQATASDPVSDFQQPNWQQPESDDPAWLPEIRQLVASNRKIEGIRMVRQYTGWGLAEAKHYVDRL